MSEEWEQVEEKGCDCPPPPEEGAPLWTVTFGDMMSLLLTFFILLFSMSELKMDRFLLASQSMREAMGGTQVDPNDDPMGLMPDPVDPDLEMQNPGLSEGSLQVEGKGEGPTDQSSDGTPDWAERLAEAYMEMIARRLEEFVEEHGLQETITVDREPEGVYLRIQSVVLFESGSGSVQPAGRTILETLSQITREIDVRVIISGHADDRPIRTPQFASNWELSAARAAGVARSLVGHGHAPTMLRVESWGEYQPIADNDSAEGRARNRRVELLYSKKDILEQAFASLAEEEVNADGEPQAPTPAVEEPAGTPSGA